MKHSPLITGTELFQVGHWFQRSERLFEIRQWDAAQPLQLQARAADDGTLHWFTLTELFAATPCTRFGATQAELLGTPSSTSPATSKVVDATTLPTNLLRRADQLIETVEFVQAQLAKATRQQQLTATTSSLTEITRQACHVLPSPICLSSYYAYRALYQTHHGDRAGIAAALHRTTFGKTQIDPNAQHFIDTLIRRFYRSNPPLRAQTVYAIAQELWRHNRHWWLKFPPSAGTDTAELVERLLEGRTPIDPLLAEPRHAACLTQIKLPSRTWFYGYVSWFRAQPNEGKAVYVTRHGQAEWESNFLLFDRFSQTATLPLQYVFADHYKLDVLHVDDECREALGRLWLTLFIDAYSRAVLGLLLSYEDPQIESIQGALRHAIWPKTGLAEFGIELPWTCFGIPQRLFLDNAWAHQSYSLEELARALADGGRYTPLELVFRPPYQARYGGLVERLFGNLSGQLRERLPGAILQPSQRHWHNATQGACLLYRDVLRVVHQLVADYLHTPHRELAGMTPHEKWLSGLQLMLPVPPPLTPQLERCFWRLHPNPRSATHNGLSLFGLHYWEVGLDGLRHPDRQGRRRRFSLRYDPLDISRVAVFEEGLWLGDGFARDLRLPDGQYESVSLWELELAKALVRQQNPSRPLRPHSWLVHLLEARELIAQRQSEQKQIRRKQQQLRERRRGRPPNLKPEPQPTENGQVEEPRKSNTALPSSLPDPRTELWTKLEEVL